MENNGLCGMGTLFNTFPDQGFSSFFAVAAEIAMLPLQKFIFLGIFFTVFPQKGTAYAETFQQFTPLL